MKAQLFCLFTSIIAAVAAETPGDTFEIKADRFADVQVLRYRAPGFEKLSLNQKKLAYFLVRAGLSGRDIFYDQKYKNNLLVRKTLEGVLTSYRGDKSAPEYQRFLVYAKRVFFANGIHHHYSNIKMIPDFSSEFLGELLAGSDPKKLPLEGRDVAAFVKILTPILFDPAVDGKVVDQSPGVDHIQASANNFYQGVTQKEAEDFYADMAKTGNPRVSYGLNSKLVGEGGKVAERIWKVGGMYGPAIQRITYWLEKAVSVAENEAQATAFRNLIKYYRTGSISDFDAYSIAWVKDTASQIDAVNGFIEVYQDPLQKKGSYESVVSMRDEQATLTINAISSQAEWFENHSPIMDAHKKKNVTGISAKVITVLGEAGDSAPVTPVGINLPNAEWIREEHGSKSVSLGNITECYNYVRSKSPSIKEFGENPEVIARVRKFGSLASSLHVDMHEVIGHASGQIVPGVATPDKSLKNYAGTLEEARADLVGLYYIMDPKLVDIGVMPSLDVGKAGYDYSILDGLLTQLYKVKPGDNLEEAHMRNRQMNAAWVYAQGRKDNVIEKIKRDGKTYYRINDYEKLRGLFGQLLREIQRIKSEGDFEAGKQLVETYGVRVDQELLKEVHARFAPLDVAPYFGFIQPKLVPVMKDGEIADVLIEYPSDFIEQMLEFGRDYAFLPLRN